MKTIAVEDVADEKICPFVNVTNDREAHPKRWIAVLVQMNCEKKSAEKLKRTGYETYIPIQQEMHRWSDRRKKVDRIVIPMVVFVRATLSDEMWLRGQSYILKLLALPGSEEAKRKLATPIPDEQVERLRFLLENAENEVTIIGKLKVGDAVHIVSGPLEGLEGVVSDADDKSSIVGILIDGLGYACVKIEKEYLSCKN